MFAQITEDTGNPGIDFCWDYCDYWHLNTKELRVKNSKETNLWNFDLAVLNMMTYSDHKLKLQNLSVWLILLLTSDIKFDSL